MPSLVPQPSGHVPAAQSSPLAPPAWANSWCDMSPAAFDAHVQAFETARAEADPWLRPAVDRRCIRALGDAFHRPYHVLDQADLPEETEEEKLTPTPLHVMVCADLFAGLRIHYAERDDVAAAVELGHYYDTQAGQDPGRVAPDLSVVFGTGPRIHSSFVFWRQRRTPAFVMEVLSPATWRRDLGIKRDIYAKLRIRDYVIFDPGDHISPRLLGLTLWQDGYRRVPVEELPGGMVGVYSQALGLYVCHEKPWPAFGWHTYRRHGRVRWYDPAARAYLQTPEEIAMRLGRESDRAAHEAKRADDEARRAEHEAKRADDEATRAEHEAKRADDAEARVAELTARLRTLTQRDAER